MIWSICVALLSILTLVPMIQAGDNAEHRERPIKVLKIREARW
jgi:hypothetical protein